MNSSRMKAYLFLTILILSVLPLGAAYFLMGDILETSLQVGFNSETRELIALSQANLKTLRDKDPANIEAYREQFRRFEALQTVYDDLPLLLRSVREPIKLYFMAGLLAVVALSLAAATSLGRSISRSYAELFQKTLRQRERLDHLEDMSKWQGIARRLAHEIKNPLTPIEMLISSLPQVQRAQTDEAFAEHLVETRRIILEEIGHLKNLVYQFSEFSRLPKVQPEPVNLSTFLTDSLKASAPAWPGVTFKINGPEGALETPVEIDRALFRQVLNNLILNAVEANPERPIEFIIDIQRDGQRWAMTLSNDGAPIPESAVPHIFKAHFSTKTAKSNMGLGLAIVKKIVLEHDGDIVYAPGPDQRPSFRIELPAKG